MNERTGVKNWCHTSFAFFLIALTIPRWYKKRHNAIIAYPQLLSEMHIAERAMYNALVMMFKTSAIVLSFGIISISLPFNQKVVANLCYADA